jgi:hypothetical protein
MWERNQMRNKKGFLALATGLAITVILTVAACSSSASPPTTAPPSGGAVINSDSVVTAQIRSIHRQSSGYPWAVDVLIQSSVDVDTLPNPTKDSVGKTITVQTDQDMTSYKAGDVITARIKYTGDVPKPGITLYMYDIAPEIRP